MKWNGRYYRPAFGVPVYPKKEQSITELLKPLGEKIDKGNVWRPILNQPINVFKEDIVPSPSPTPTSTVTPTPSITPTSTLTPTPSVTATSTLTPTPSITPTGTATPTPSVTPTSTATPTPSITPTVTITPTITTTPTPSPSPFVVFEAEYQAVIDKANLESYILPSYPQQILQNQLVIDLKFHGIWGQLDVFYVMACDAASQNFTSLNWKQPATFFQMGYVNSPVFVVNKGMKGDGISARLTTGINLPALDADPARNYKAEDACRFSWIFTGTSFDSTAIDCTTNGVNFTCLANTIGQRINTSDNLTSAVDFTGLDRMKFISRYSATDVVFRNGAVSGNRTIAGAAVTNLDGDLTLLGRPAGNHSDYGLSIYGIGLAIHEPTLNTILNDYMTAI